MSLILLSDGVKIGLGSELSFWRICESREGPIGLGIAVDRRSWEGKVGKNVDAIELGPLVNLLKHNHRSLPSWTNQTHWLRDVRGGVLLETGTNALSIHYSNIKIDK